MVYQARDPLKVCSDDWDIICIGSGITSLTYAAAAVRLHPGVRILVIDKHFAPGGYATDFRRPKHAVRFDCSLHKLSGMGERGNLRRLLRELDLESELSLQLSPLLCEVAFPHESAKETRLRLPADSDLALQMLLERFPHEAVGVRRFFNDVSLYGQNLYMQFQTITGDFEPNVSALRYASKHFKHLSVADALRERISDPVLREILSLPAIYVGAFPEQLGYLYFLHIVYACQFMGCAYVAGGAQHLSNVLVERIRAGGGEILLKTSVERILLDTSGQRVMGVQTKRGCFRTSNVVINAAPQHALEDLFESTAELTPTREAVAKLCPSNATTTLYLVTDQPPEQLGLADAETMILASQPDNAIELRQAARQEPEHSPRCEEAYWNASTIEVTNYHLLDSSGGNAVVINALDSIHHWPQRKTPEYRAKKQRAASVLLNRIYAATPQLRGHVLYSEVSSPRTYWRYTNNTAGSGYGALIEPGASAHGFHYRFPIDGVTFMSAWVAGSGYEAGMGYAAFKARCLPRTPVPTGEV